MNNLKLPVLKTALHLITFTFLFHLLQAQPDPEPVYSPTIRSVKLFKKGEQLVFPVIRLGNTEQFELRFDDLQSSPKNYFYTFILCNADWSRTNLSQMDYIKGFTQNRMNQYRASSATFTRYFHYSALLPDRNCQPSRSGNYMLLVFLNGDTSQVVFTKRFLVVEEKATVAGDIRQPFNQNFFRSHQKVITKVDTRALDIFNPAQQLKLVVMQNHRWDMTQSAANPTFIRGKQFEYNAEDNFIFEGGKEWRWLDLRSLRLQSDRVASVDYNPNSYDIYVRPDTVRSPLRYIYFSDMNGRYFIDNLENVNPWWMSDYANVHFTFLPTDPSLFRGQRIFLYGEMTNYQLSEDFAMTWNDNLQVYEMSLLLKNGYYSYIYVTRPINDTKGLPKMHLTEGNNWETENTYSIMLYYRPFGGRADELVGYTEVNSLTFLSPTMR
ncbi:MAG TPA: DUF5103 domain-containing protein [Phnomibacter sp.]|nr:DUF5103 domain-containing protein [Phnomibacter sp.]